MRTGLFLLLSIALTTSFGCTFLKRFNDSEPKRVLSTEPITAVTAEQLVGYLNQQAGHVQTLRYPDVRLDVETPEGSNTLGISTLICSQPGNFHLAGGKLGVGKLIEIGSNEREFWMVTERPLEPTYIYCTHEDFQGGAAKKLPFPFDPKWALQALGMSTYDPRTNYTVQTDKENQEHLLSFESVTPQGDAVRNVIAFDANPAFLTTPRVLRHTIFGQDDQLIAMARIDAVDTRQLGTDPHTGRPISVQVPTRVHLKWPMQQSSMDLRLDDARLNQPLTEQEKRDFFQRPNPDGVNPINLAQYGSVN